MGVRNIILTADQINQLNSAANIQEVANILGAGPLAQSADAGISDGVDYYVESGSAFEAPPGNYNQNNATRLLTEFLNRNPSVNANSAVMDDLRAAFAHLARFCYSDRNDPTHRLSQQEIIAHHGRFTPSTYAVALSLGLYLDERFQSATHQIYPTTTYVYRATEATQVIGRPPAPTAPLPANVPITVIQLPEDPCSSSPDPVACRAAQQDQNTRRNREARATSVSATNSNALNTIGSREAAGAAGILLLTAFTFFAGRRVGAAGNTRTTAAVAETGSTASAASTAIEAAVESSGAATRTVREQSGLRQSMSEAINRIRGEQGGEAAIRDLTARLGVRESDVARLTDALIESAANLRRSENSLASTRETVNTLTRKISELEALLRDGRTTNQSQLAQVTREILSVRNRLHNADERIAELSVFESYANGTATTVANLRQALQGLRTENAVLREALIEAQRALEFSSQNQGWASGEAANQLRRTLNQLRTLRDAPATSAPVESILTEMINEMQRFLEPPGTRPLSPTPRPADIGHIDLEGF